MALTEFGSIAIIPEMRLQTTDLRLEHLEDRSLPSPLFPLPGTEPSFVEPHTVGVTAPDMVILQKATQPMQKGYIDHSTDSLQDIVTRLREHEVAMHDAALQQLFTTMPEPEIEILDIPTRTIDVQTLDTVFAQQEAEERDSDPLQDVVRARTDALIHGSVRNIAMMYDAHQEQRQAATDSVFASWDDATEDVPTLRGQEPIDTSAMLHASTIAAAALATSPRTFSTQPAPTMTTERPAVAAHVPAASRGMFGWAKNAVSSVFGRIKNIFRR